MGEEIFLRFPNAFRDFSPGIGEDAQVALGRNAGVKLPQRTGGGVAGIGEGFFAFGLIFLIQGQKVGFGHVNFTADFEDIGNRSLNFYGQGTDCAQVGSDVFSSRAVAAGCALNEFAFFITGGKRQAVNFGLAHEGRRFGRIEKALDAHYKIVKLFNRKNITQRKHRKAVADFAELAFYRRADPTGRAVGTD